MLEDEVGGVPIGRYHAHLEFDKEQAIPSNVTATNLTSNPASRASLGIVDAVVVTKSVYNPVSKTLCIAAHSGDETSPVPLSLNAPSYGAFGAPTKTCSGVASNDVVLEKDLNTFAPDLRNPPEGIIVQSDLGGSETSHPLSLTGSSDADLVVGAVNDVFANVEGSGTTSLDLTGNIFNVDGASGLIKSAGLDTPPANFRIVVVSQPEVGTVAAPASGGNVTYTADVGMETSTQSFFYAIQNTTNNTVSNVARVDLGVIKVTPPPVGIADRQGVFRASAGAIIRVLANDTTGLSTTAIDPATVQIATVPGRGTATANADGTITYTPVSQGGTANNTIDTFTYTVANVGGARSLPITVQLALKTAAEAVTFQRVRFNNAWDIRFTSSYAGAAGAINLAPTATCALTANPGAPTRVGPIGGVVNPTAGANNYVVIGGTPVPSGNNWTARCVTSSGGAQNRTGTL